MRHAKKRHAHCHHLTDQSMAGLRTNHSSTALRRIMSDKAASPGAESMNLVLGSAAASAAVRCASRRTQTRGKTQKSRPSSDAHIGRQAMAHRARGRCATYSNCNASRGAGLQLGTWNPKPGTLAPGQASQARSSQHFSKYSASASCKWCFAQISRFPAPRSNQVAPFFMWLYSRHPALKLAIPPARFCWHNPPAFPNLKSS
jgi:hypothetical protein